MSKRNNQYEKSRREREAEGKPPRTKRELTDLSYKWFVGSFVFEALGHLLTTVGLWDYGQEEAGTWQYNADTTLSVLMIVVPFVSIVMLTVLYRPEDNE